MRRLRLICAAVLTLQAPAAAQGEQGVPVIPLPYQGRWADKPAQCAQPESVANSIMTITARGWRSWEEGGDILRVGQVRGDTRYFRVRNFWGENGEADDTLALRLVAGRLHMSFNGHDGPVHYVMYRCPSRPSR